jgi:hypothetical protein
MKTQINCQASLIAIFWLLYWLTFSFLQARQAQMPKNAFEKHRISARRVC